MRTAAQLDAALREDGFTSPGAEIAMWRDLAIKLENRNAALILEMEEIAYEARNFGKDEVQRLVKIESIATTTLASIPTPQRHQRCLTNQPTEAPERGQADPQEPARAARS